MIAYCAAYSDDGYQLASAQPRKSGFNPIGRGRDRRTWRIQRLLQGAARQAWSDRQRISGRALTNLRCGAVSAQRHVARSKRELPGIRPGPARKLARERCSRREGRRPRSTTYMRRHRAGCGGDAAGGDLAKAAPLAARPGRQASATGGVFEARLAGLGGADDGASSAATQRIKLNTYIAETGVNSNPRGPIGVVTVAGDHHRRQSIRTGTSRRRRHCRGDRARTARRGRLKALVVRVDSPGGSVMASERIRQAILAAKAKRFRWSCRWAMSPHRAAIGSRPRAIHLCRALDDHRIDRRVRRPAELPRESD